MVRKHSKRIFLFLTVAWAALILVITLTPGKYVPSNELFGYDKLGHTGIFCIQTLFLMLTLSRYNVTYRKSVIISVVACALYGFLIEGLQHLIPGRAMDWVDALSNILGSFLAIGLFNLVNKPLKLKNI